MATLASIIRLHSARSIARLFDSRGAEHFPVTSATTETEASNEKIVNRIHRCVSADALGPGHKLWRAIPGMPSGKSIFGGAMGPLESLIFSEYLRRRMFCL